MAAKKVTAETSNLSWELRYSICGDEFETLKRWNQETSPSSAEIQRLIDSFFMDENQSFNDGENVRIQLIGIFMDNEYDIMFIPTFKKRELARD